MAEDTNEVLLIDQAIASVLVQCQLESKTNFANMKTPSA
jgi:hypothetical protein